MMCILRVSLCVKTVFKIQWCSGKNCTVLHNLGKDFMVNFFFRFFPKTIKGEVFSIIERKIALSPFTGLFKRSEKST